ncbi:MAG: hypothetical protein Q9218_004579 [Villophora microphyllina]
MHFSLHLDDLPMTVSFEEFEAEGLTQQELLAQWESDNKALQPHKFIEHFQLTPKTLEQWWSLKDLHEFCLKICAIYATVENVWKKELAEYLWVKWFRNGESPCRFGNFFARYIGCYKPESPKAVSNLLEAHRRICAQIMLRQVTLNANDIGPMPHTIDNRENDPRENHENFVVEPVYLAVFMIFDTVPLMNSIRDRARDDRDLAATPALLVRTGDDHDLLTGPIDFGAIDAVSEGYQGNRNVRRIALGDAVDFVLDLHRRNNEYR